MYINNINKYINLIIKVFIREPRHFQITYLSSFLIAGIFLLNWSEDIIKYILIISIALAIQTIGIYIVKGKSNSWKSALITALGLCLLCKTNNYETATFAAVIAISSKFLIRYNNKHIFNPVNIGIVLSIFLTNDAWISPGQWGSHFIILFVLGILGFLVLKKVDRIDASLTFLFVFGGLQYIRLVLLLGWSFDVFLHQITSGTLVLFTFFMITDPMTTPNHKGARITWVVIISVISFLLSNYMYIYAAPIWVLFFAAPFTPVFDKIFIAPKFEWVNSKSITQHN